ISSAGALGAGLTSPESTAIRQIVKLIEQHAAIPSGLGSVIHIGSLPGINRPAPAVFLQQACTCDLPRIRARSSKEVGIAAQPFAPIAKLYDGEIPGEHHGNLLLLARGKREFNGDRAGQGLASAGIVLA